MTKTSERATAPRSVRTRRPDFFIVGAPKSGTTAMYDYLRQHPQIFMADTKELHFFGSDFVRRRTPRLTEREYLAYFAGAGDALRVGEASVRYLHSKRAAQEIAAFSPDARAIIMLRNPVDMMHAMHSELLFSGMEEITDFAEALEAEHDRREGRRIPPATNIAEVLQYRDSARFAEQVERYFRALGRERTHVIIYDDFGSDTLGSYRATLRFLEVDDSFEPHISVVNPSKRPRSRLLQRFMANPPGWIRAPVRRIVPRPVRKRIYKRALVLNARPTSRPPVDPGLRERLTREFEPEVRRLEALLDRDLSSWMRA
jgi:Sulfotransferase domain